MSCTGHPVFLFAKFDKATSTGAHNVKRFARVQAWSVSTNPFGCLREQNPFPLKSKQQVAVKLGRILTLGGTRSDTPALTTALLIGPCSVLLFSASGMMALSRLPSLVLPFQLPALDGDR